MLCRTIRLERQTLPPDWARTHTVSMHTTTVICTCKPPPYKPCPSKYFIFRKKPGRSFRTSSRAAVGRNRLNCVIFVVYTLFTNVAAGPIIEAAGRMGPANRGWSASALNVCCDFMFHPLERKKNQYFVHVFRSFSQ